MGHKKQHKKLMREVAFKIWLIQPTFPFICLFVWLCLISFLQESGFFNPLFQPCGWSRLSCYHSLTLVV